MINEKKYKRMKVNNMLARAHILENYRDFKNELNKYMSSKYSKIDVFNILNISTGKFAISPKAKQFYKDHNLNMFFEASAKTGFNSQKIFVEAANILFTESMKVTNEINKSKLDDLKSPYLNLGQDGNINFDDDDKTKKRCCK